MDKFKKEEETNVFLGFVENLNCQLLRFGSSLRCTGPDLTVSERLNPICLYAWTVEDD